MYELKEDLTVKTMYELLLLLVFSVLSIILLDAITKSKDRIDAESNNDQGSRKTGKISVSLSWILFFMGWPFLSSGQALLQSEPGIVGWFDIKEFYIIAGILTSLVGLICILLPFILTGRQYFLIKK